MIHSASYFEGSALGPGQMRFFGMHETPQLVELAFGDVEVVPQGEHDRTAVACDPIQPSADRIFVHLHDPRRGP